MHMPKKEEKKQFEKKKATINWAYREKIMHMPKKEEKKQFEKKKATINWAYREKNMHMPKKRINIPDCLVYTITK